MSNIYGTGTISRYLADRGFGWILPADQNEPEIFFHKDNARNICPEDLTPGQAVFYVPAVSNEGRPFARAIRFASEEASTKYQ